MGSCKNTSKCVVALIGLVFWGVAAALVFVGAYVFKSYGDYENLTQAKYTLIPAITAILVGLFMFVTGIIGCTAACKGNRCSLAVFFGLMIAILCLQVAAGVFSYIYKDKIDQNFHVKLDSALNKYGFANQTELQNEIDYMQSELRCCGRDNYSDWESTPWGAAHADLVPQSCCRDGGPCNATISNPDEIYVSGCYVVLKEEFQNNLGYIIGIAIGFATILILGLIFSCILFWQKKEIPYTTLVSGYSV